MKLFYDSYKYDRKIEFYAFAGYYIVVALFFLIFNTIIITLIINIVSLFLITGIYDGNLMKSVAATSLIYFTLAIVDISTNIIASTIVSNLNVLTDNVFIIVLYLSIIISFTLVYLLGKFKNINNDNYISFKYRIVILIIPVLSFLLILHALQLVKMTVYRILLVFISALSINFFVFYLYDKIIDAMKIEMELNELKQSRTYRDYQQEMIKSDMSNVNGIRNDIKNTLIPLVNKVKANDVSGMEVELESILGPIDDSKPISYTGNLIVDSILNYKFQYAERDGIDVSTRLSIPTDVNMPELDLAIIIGNLVDNAIDNVIKAEDKWIHIDLQYAKGVLRLVVTNSFDGIVEKSGEKFLTTKPNKDISGLGLRTVELLVERYDGMIKYNHDEDTFRVALVLLLVRNDKICEFNL